MFETVVYQNRCIVNIWEKQMNCLFKPKELSNEQRIMLRLIDVETFCDPHTDLDFGRKEMITNLALLHGKFQHLYYDDWVVGNPNCDYFHNVLETIMDIDNVNCYINFLLFGLLDKHFRARLHPKSPMFTNFSNNYIEDLEKIDVKYFFDHYLPNIIKVTTDMGY